VTDDRPFPNLVIVGRDIPDVMECHGHRGGPLLEPRTCPQCDGSHDHAWVQCIVLDKAGTLIGEATRCRICGGRKCDDHLCRERRHHRGPHIDWNGRLRRVGV
jgi:hypothetical protein